MATTNAGQPVLLHVQASSPDAVRVADSPGLLSCRVMARIADYTYAAPGGLPALVMAEFDNATDAAKAAGQQPAAGATAVVNVYRQISPARGWLTAAGGKDTAERPVGSAVLSVVMDVERAALADFHGWYDEEHLPKLVEVPGILCAQRFAALDADEAPGTAAPDGDRARFLARYEMASPDVVASPEFAAASVMTPRTEAVTAHLAWASQLYREASSAS